jgi:hypothetical protein
MNLREDELLVKMPQRLPARLTQRRYDADPEVKRHAPARGQYWGEPLGPEHPDGPLTPPPPLELSPRRPARPRRTSAALALEPPTWTRPPQRSSTT